MVRLGAAASPLLLVLLGCAPDTQVHDEGRAPTRPAPAGGARSPAGPPAGQDPRPGPAAVDPGGGPVLQPLSLSVSGACLRLRAESSTSVNALVNLSAGEISEEHELGRGATLFDIALAPSRLPPGHQATAVLLAVDAQGRRAMTEPAGFAVPRPASLPLVISEVLPNPAGAETTQEYLELLNRGPDPVALGGLVVEDEGGGLPLPAETLPPGARALVVGKGFDETGGGDTPVRPGTLILRLGGRLGRDGLKQTGEVVRLLAADGSLISSYGGWVDTTRGAWQGKSVHRQPDEGACDHPRSWTMAPLPATPGF